MWRILCPYLININKLSKELAAIIIKDWLEKCDKARKVEFNPQRDVNIQLKNVKSFLPSSKENLEKRPIYPSDGSKSGVCRFAF